MATKEEIHDSQITPLVERIIEICEEHGINAHLTFDLDEAGRCTTNLPLDGMPVWLRLMRYASQAGDNFDAFMIAVMRDAEAHGHSSAVLEMLGVKPRGEGEISG